MALLFVESRLLSAKYCSRSPCIRVNTSTQRPRRAFFTCYCSRNGNYSSGKVHHSLIRDKFNSYLSEQVAPYRFAVRNSQKINFNFARLYSQSEKSKFFEKENIWTVPNLLSLLRISAAPLLGWCVLGGHHVAAVSIFVLAGLSDWIDGFIARNVPGQLSSIGSVLDPLADKLLACVLFVALTKAGYLPLWLTFIVLGRDALLVLGGFYLRYITLPSPKTWSRYWDIQRSTLTVTPSVVSKVNTLFQMLLLGLTLASPVFGFEHHSGLHILWYLTGLTTVVSGWSYFFSRNGFKLLKSKKHTTVK